MNAVCCWRQRMDLGECQKLHDIALVADYNNASKNRDYFYDVDVCNSVPCGFSESVLNTVPCGFSESVLNSFNTICAKSI